MVLIGLYLSMSEWYTVCNKLLQAGEVEISGHILNEIGYCLDVAPQYYNKRCDCCQICTHFKECTIATAWPLCSQFERGVI